jgi:RNA polymerase sigma-70 factor (ECF subfamily)
MPANESSTAPRPEKLSLPDLFREQEAPLLRYAYSLTGKRVVAEDVVQEVFLQLHQHWDEVDNPVSWLFRSVRNRAYNHHRDHRREVLTDNTESSETMSDETHSLLHRMEAAGFLRLLLSELEESDRTLIRLKYYDDLKYKEISEQTGLSISNVGYRLHHLLKELAENLRQIGIKEAP